MIIIFFGSEFGSFTELFSNVTGVHFLRCVVFWGCSVKNFAISLAAFGCGSLYVSLFQNTFFCTHIAQKLRLYTGDKRK